MSIEQEVAAFSPVSSTGGRKPRSDELIGREPCRLQSVSNIRSCDSLIRNEEKGNTPQESM
jgi:hypothetical protein